MIFANFRIEGKVGELIDLSTQPNIKGEKRSTFCFKSFLAISDEWDALFVFKLFSSFSTSVRNTVYKEQPELHFL